MVPIKGTNMRNIYIFEKNSTQPKVDKSYKIQEESILFYVNGSRPVIRVACSSLGGGQNETAGHQRTLLTVKGKLLQPEKYYKENLYK